MMRKQDACNIECCGKVQYLLSVIVLLKIFKVARAEIGRKDQCQQTLRRYGRAMVGGDRVLSVRARGMVVMRYRRVQQRNAVRKKNQGEPSPGFHAPKIGDLALFSFNIILVTIAPEAVEIVFFIFRTDTLVTHLAGILGPGHVQIFG